MCTYISVLICTIVQLYHAFYFIFLLTECDHVMWHSVALQALVTTFYFTSTTIPRIVLNTGTYISCRIQPLQLQEKNPYVVLRAG